MNLRRFRAQWDYLSSQPGFRATPVRVLTRLLRWRLLCLIKKPVTLRLREQQLTLFLPPEWHGTSKLLYIFRDAYEPDLAILARFLSPGKVMIDVGANYGIFSLNASRIVGRSGKVVAFEPARDSFATLQKNLALNAASNVQPMRLALAQEPGKLRLYHDPDPTRNSLAPARSSEDFEEVEVRTLDGVLAESGVGPVDFLKIDVEGADELVCRGALGTLRTHLPPIFFEHNPIAASRMGLKETGTSDVLRELGYEFFQSESQQLVKLCQEALCEGNVLALHPQNRSRE